MATPAVRVVIAGGGTAGHVLPAIAVARALVERGHPSDAITFVGSGRGIEARLVPAAGFQISLLPGRGIQRRATFENVGAAVGLVVGFFRAMWKMLRCRPGVVVSVGGYASVPCSTAAVLLRVPLVLVGLDAVPGAALRLVGRFARASAVAFEGTRLPRARVTGNPVRSEIASIDRAADRDRARRALGLPVDRRVVAVFGGSLGSLRINRAVLGAVAHWKDRSDIAVYQVVGERDWALVSSEAASLPHDGLIWRRAAYEERMDLLYAAADLAVCRAGATTVAELAVVGLPAILVPLPGAPGDHQTQNARALVSAGGARLVRDEDLSGDRLATEVEELLDTPELLVRMATAARRVARPHAADEVAGLIEECARG